MNIHTKRVYDPPSPDDGFRLLIMRRWPRDVRKDAVDEWQPELGPSLALLREWRGGQMEWREYAQRYKAEMAQKPQLLASVRRRAQKGAITLLCGCPDADRCHRTLLQAILQEG